MRQTQYSIGRALLAALLVTLLSTAALSTGALSNAARAADPQNAEREKELIGVLQTSPPPEKAIACKKLAIYGSKAAVPELAKLLADPELASWARIALEAIPDPAADEALRSALGALKGRLAIGTINSLGVRRDAGSVDVLVGRLKDPEADVASASAVALGRVGNAAATAALRQSLAAAPAGVRSAVAEGCILCAERLLAEGKNKQAVEIYDEVRKAEVPRPRKLEATRGAILARKNDGLPLLVELIKSPDKGLMQIGLTAARELPGREVADALAAELASAPADRAALLLYVLADRSDSVVSPAVLAAAKGGDKQVQIAAISVIGRSGDASAVAGLIDLATAPDEEVSQAAKGALAALPGQKVDAEIASRLPQAEGKALSVLIETVGQRRIPATAPLVKGLANADPAIRAAALAALGETIGPKELAVLVDPVLSPKSPEDGKVAARALQTACVRMTDREACAAELAAALTRAPAPAKKDLLTVLGAMGGPKALATIAAAMNGGDEELQDVGSRLLGEWMTADAAPVLLEQAKTASGDKYQVRALRGYIRIARQFTLPAEQRAEMCRRALEAAGRGEEQKLVLAVLERYPHPDTLKVAIQATEVPGLKDDAGRTALIVAQKLGNDSPDVRAQLAKAGLEPLKVEIIKALYGAGGTQRDVTAQLQKHAKGLAVIELPSQYNEVFGGDPIPGTIKTLKVQYRLNGKTGEATFDENAPISLPVPK